MSSTSILIGSRVNPVINFPSQGIQVKTLQSTLEKAGLAIPAAESTATTYGSGTVSAIRQFQANANLPVTGMADAITLSLLNNAAAQAAATQANLSGVLVMDYGLPAPGMTVRLYSIGYGGVATKLAEAKTDATGVYSLSYTAPATSASIQVRAVDATGKETVLSSPLFGAGQQGILHLVAPSSLQPLTAEYTRLSADVQKQVGGTGFANLANAQETGTQKDLTLLTNAMGWDARLLSLAASAAQTAKSMNLGEDVLYALFRAGLPTDVSQLALTSPATVTAALNKARTAGIITLTDQDVTNTVTAFQQRATRVLTSLKAPGGISTGGDLLTSAGIADATQQNNFVNLVLNNPTPGTDFWQQAASLKIPADTLSKLQVQGKCFYLTNNNLALSKKVQADVGTDLSQLPEKDYHDPATWKTALTGLSTGTGAPALDTLIPPSYTGATADRLAAYSADLARKVRVSYPSQTVARMVENNTLPIGASAQPVAAFLKSATAQGYQLGRTPLNAFLKTSGKGLPALSTADTTQLKTLHRLFQLTPSNESMQAALASGFTSASDIATKYTRSAFMEKYAAKFPSSSEADLVYRKAQQITSVTFNFFAMAKGLDTKVPIYSLSASAQTTQTAKNSIVEQFPSMQAFFGSLDFCDCDDCQSVLSPAAYFVDVLEFLGQSAANGKNYTPLDVLIGSQDGVIGPGKIPPRRADLAALPLTCANTNTTLPYIDIVNEILEYYVSYGKLDSGLAYDTGDVATEDLTAEPQHVLAPAYAQLMQRNSAFGYALGLPFDLWAETVRGFYAYFKIPLSQVLEVMRPVDQLELFTDAKTWPYYRAAIFAEMLRLSPAEYALFTNSNPLQTWYSLYGYPNENIALNGGVFPAAPPNFSYSSLYSAKALAQNLGLSYQQLTQLLTTGFLNPALAAISYPFQRFGIDISKAFSYTGQNGFSALSSADKTAFEAELDALTAQYKAADKTSTFDARTWLTGLLPAGYSDKVLVLADPNSGCDFSGTTLKYASGTAATTLDLLKINLFVRLLNRTGWEIDELDSALQLFFATGPGGLPATTNANFGTAFSQAWESALVYLAHLGEMAADWSPSPDKTALLPLWAPIAVNGNDPLYAQLFLTQAVLTIDDAFDDPLGKFPGKPSDPLQLHLAGIQGALGLSATDAAAILEDADASLDKVSTNVNGQPVQVPAFTLKNLSLLYRYNSLAGSLGLPVVDFITLKTLAVDQGGVAPGTVGLDPFTLVTGLPLKVLSDDILFTQTLQFAREAGQVAGSGFTMEDLRYLLLHDYDPVGEYSVDQNALISLAQSLASALLQVRAANAVPADVNGMSDDLIQQRLSGLLPASLLKTVTGLLTNTSAFTGSASGIALANEIDPSTFSAFPELSFTYDQVQQLQTVNVKGLLLDWKKTAWETINTAAFFATILNGIQQQAKPTFDAMVSNLLGAWANLVRYEATRPVAAALVFPNPSPDAAFATAYDPVNKVQWAVYRGVLTDAAKATLTAVNATADFAALLADLQSQALPAFNELLSYLLGLWVSSQLYQTTQTAVAAKDALDASVFAAYPQVQVEYDAGTQVQTMGYNGILTVALEAKLNALIPTSTILAGLLQNLRTQTMALYQNLATGWITVTLPATWDTLLDASAAPYSGLDDSKMLKTLKAELVKVFSPLVAQNLSVKLITQQLSADLGSDPSMTGSLLTDIGILADPGKPGRSLQGDFLALGVQGVTATWYGTPDQSGAPLGTGAVTAGTAGTLDPSNPGPGATASVRFEGWLQAPADGPYRFFAQLANVGAQVQFRIDAPVSAAPVNSPVISYTATKAADEVSQFVNLQGGVAYHFVIDFLHLGAGGGAGLLVQGESMPKGPLAQLQLYPRAAIDQFIAARTLLFKSLLLIAGTKLSLQEVAYLSANPDQFGGFRLGSLPTQPLTGQPARVHGLFAQFLALADYADLRKGPAGNTGGLIGVFQGVGPVFSEPLNSGASNQDTTTPWTQLGNLTRRDPQIIRDVAVQLGLLKETVAGNQLQVQALGDFANNKGIRRIWSALQAVQIIGLSVNSIVNSTGIVAANRPTLATDTGPGIAGNLRNAVRAKYPPENWRPVAKSVFDPLRQKKRDALVSYIIRDLNLNTEEQLFEYFLVDPGMEPIVQTSRLRLAMSSVQTFIQRILLDLENAHSTPELNASPSAVDADWWAWMKRYRVWEANREIFLYPENWMVPELRLGTTDLFQTMVGDLLKGDVSSDLVEAAFHKYLKGLEQRARLDIVATYLDQTGPSDASDQLYADYTLHVLGRTHGHPHSYFYRTYANGLWSPWVQVSASIDGDHIALAVWRNRVHVFWVTFNVIGKSPASPNFSSGKITDSDFSTLSGNLAQLAVQSFAQVQLNWSEYFQGSWGAQVSSDVNKYDPVPVSSPFDASQVYIHVTKGVPDTTYGIDGPINIHLDFPGVGTVSFSITNKNSNPDFGTQYAKPAVIEPYINLAPDAAEYQSSGQLTAVYTAGNETNGCPTVTPILQQLSNFGLVACSNPVSTPFLPPTNAQYQQAGPLVSPFFYKDLTKGFNLATSDESTFFVQPSITETTVETWPGWIIGVPPATINVDRDPGWLQIPLESQVPSGLVFHPPLGDPALNQAVYTVGDRTDWATSPATTISFGTSTIGANGSIVGARANSVGAGGFLKTAAISKLGNSLAITSSFLKK